MERTRAEEEDSKQERISIYNSANNKSSKIDLPATLLSNEVVPPREPGSDIVVEVVVVVASCESRLRKKALVASWHFGFTISHHQMIGNIDHDANRLGPPP